MKGFDEKKVRSITTFVREISVIFLICNIGGIVPVTAVTIRRFSDSNDTQTCKKDEYWHKGLCHRCPTPPLGMHLSEACGYGYGNSEIHTSQCPAREYNDGYLPPKDENYRCEKCRDCTRLGREVISPCTPTSNAICSFNCIPGYIPDSTDRNRTLRCVLEDEGPLRSMGKAENTPRSTGEAANPIRIAGEAADHLALILCISLPMGCIVFVAVSLVTYLYKQKYCPGCRRRRKLRTVTEHDRKNQTGSEVGFEGDTDYPVEETRHFDEIGRAPAERREPRFRDRIGRHNLNANPNHSDTDEEHGVLPSLFRQLRRGRVQLVVDRNNGNNEAPDVVIDIPHQEQGHGALAVPIQATPLTIMNDIDVSNR